MKKITVYTSESCPYCVRAKQLLAARGLVYEEILVPWSDEAAWDAMVKRSGMKTVPQIFFDDECVGGFRELSALDAAGTLAERLKS